jgi:hypothetical protein
VSAEYLVWLLRILCVSTSFTPVFGCSWPVSCSWSLELAAHRVCGRPVLLLPSLTSHTDVACAYLRPSIFATWLPISTSDCGPLPRYPAFSAPVNQSLRTTPSILSPIFRWQLWGNIFSTSEHGRYRTTGPGIHRIPGRLPLCPLFGICRPVQSRKLLTRETCLTTRKENTTDRNQWLTL